jgi:hypothetical protein
LSKWPIVAGKWVFWCGFSSAARSFPPSHILFLVRYCVSLPFRYYFSGFSFLTYVKLWT